MQQDELRPLGHYKLTLPPLVFEALPDEMAVTMSVHLGQVLEGVEGTVIADHLRVDFSCWC